MRDGREFRCANCGLTSPVGTDCPECQTPMTDENGNRSVRSSGENLTFGMLRSVLGGTGAVGAGLVLTLWGLPAMPAALGLMIGGGYVVLRSVAVPLIDGSRRVAERRVRALRMLGRARDAAPAESVVGSELVRCRGRAHALRPVDAPRQRRAVCAFQRGGDRGCGRFAVLGAHGAAVVDDDCFEIRRRGRRLALARLGGVVEDGASVEVVGPAARGPVTDAVLTVGSPDARRTEHALYFDGRPDSPVLLLL